jgi:hypothetical protein
VFIISGGTYALIAPVVGYICDTGLNPKKVMIMGSILTIISYSIVGPAPFMPLEKYGRTYVFILTTLIPHPHPIYFAAPYKILVANPIDFGHSESLLHENFDL